MHILVEGVHGVVLALAVAPRFGVRRITSAIDGVIRNKPVRATDSDIEQKVKLKTKHHQRRKSDSSKSFYPLMYHT